MPQMNFRPPLGFLRQPLRFPRPHYPQQAPQKSNLETMMESMPLVQQKQDEYINQLAFKVDVVTT